MLGRRRRVLLTAALLAAAAAVYASASVLAEGPRDPKAASQSERKSSCPADPLPLRAGSIAPASRAALSSEPPRGEPRVIGASWAPRDSSGRGETARSWCGKRAWRQTVVVTIDRRALHPSASAAAGVYFVSRFVDGYRVWGEPH